ncbi:MAG: universal stress protein [Candidatus Melainabacteria bacterium]|nr:universal stress protein [Candidatus Melainabacteria bacterium]
MKVLVAVDEQEYANAITEFVVNHGWPLGTEFTIFAVVEPLKIGNAMAVLPGPFLDGIVEDHVESAKVLVKATAAAIRNRCSESIVNEVIVEGFAAEEIIKNASDQKANLILVGSHGRSGFKRMILGSVSLAVVSHATCSVIVIRLPHSAQEELTASQKESDMMLQS